MEQRVRAIYHVITLNKPGQIRRSQIRLPWNATRLIAVDYDILFGRSARPPGGGTGDGTGTPPAIPPSGESGAGGSPPREERPTILPLALNWETAPLLTMGQLRLQSMEKARLFYNAWIKATRWDNGFQSGGVFPYQAQSRLEKPRPLRVDVPKTTTIIRALYEDQVLKNGSPYPDYQLKIILWVETNEPANGVNYEFLNP